MDGTIQPKANRFIGRCGMAYALHVCVCAKGCWDWSDTFIIHYVYSKRNVRICAISSSCRDLLEGGGVEGYFLENRQRWCRNNYSQTNLTGNELRTHSLFSNKA